MAWFSLTSVQHQTLPVLPSQCQTSSARPTQRFTVQELPHSRLGKRQPIRRLVMAKGRDNVTLGINGHSLTEEVIKYREAYSRPMKLR
jgi:hypothetical protein